MNNELHQWMQSTIHIAKKAGDKIMAVYASEFAVTHKDDNSPLTEADMAAHNCIIAGLQQLTPDIPILSEESADIPFEERSQWQTYWLVDPLDGTREFIKRNGEFTVNIALIDNHEPVIGVIYAPVLDVFYYACRGTGAFKQDQDAEPVAIHTRTKRGKVMLIAGSRSHRGDSLNQMLENIGQHRIISMGSSLKSCLVAEGKVDVYPRLGPTSEWDTAAAQCIVEEAGGVVTTTDMQPMRYNTKESLLNPHFFVSGDPGFDWSQFL
jgi:3'(2'), 5'-bisphosphate nucleotidase